MKKIRAIIVGGGFAGLVMAKVLSEHFDFVVIVERDEKFGSDQPRTGAAQGNHLHVLLKSGQEILSDLFPEIENKFKAAQCPTIDWAADTTWETDLGAFPRYESMIKTVSFSRPYLENAIHTSLFTNSKIEHYPAQVDQLLYKDDRVVGVKCLNHPDIFGDIVVIAGGQNFPISRFIDDPSFDDHTVSFPIQITYRSIVLKTDSLSLGDSKQYYYQIRPPSNPIGAVVCPIEKGRSIGTIIEHGPFKHRTSNFKEFLSQASRVPGGKFNKILQFAEPLSEVSVYHKPTMYLRRPHKTSTFPKNVYCVGDTFCSLNPVFGQGMSAVLMQSKLLSEFLEKENFDSSKFHQASAQIMRLPFWMSKVGSAEKENFVERYFRAYLTRSLKSKKLHRRFLNVLHLQGSYSDLIDLTSLISALFGYRGSND